MAFKSKTFLLSVLVFALALEYTLCESGQTTDFNKNFYQVLGIGR